MQKTENKSFYEAKWEEEWGFAREQHGPIFFHRKRMIRKMIENYPLNGKILDIGCGDGSLLSLFRGGGNKLYGCDISEKAIELAKNKFGDIAIFTTGDITHFNSLPEGEFDVIICSELLEHIENDELAIKNLYYKLKKGGYLIVTTPHREKYWLLLDEIDGHVRRYEKAELEKKLTRNGFTVCESKTWGYPLLHLYYTLVLNKVKGRAKMKIVKKTKQKQIFSIILRSIFYLDDLFIPLSKGRNLFLLARKK
ncbi:class I SAM-dependent methyltransferase [Methanophagales archaeon]|nr:MAG: class I SAM-dependent methyltransferase [Methanophagales archaeon]